MRGAIAKAFDIARSENRPALLTYTVAGDNNKKKSLLQYLNDSSVWKSIFRDALLQQHCISHRLCPRIRKLK